MASAERLTIAAPRTLREALSVSYTHRERVRWLIGTSPLLGAVYTHVPRDAQILDARGVREFTAAGSGEAARVRFGAFASAAALRAHPVLERVLFGAANAALRLAVAEASVEIVSLGKLRMTPIDGLVLAVHEAPVTVQLGAGDEDVYLERRRAILDGEASHELILAAQLRAGDDGRLTRVRVAFSLDGEAPIRGRLVEHHLEGHRLSSERSGDAARLCAAAIVPSDARTAAAARSALPLALALLREARVRCDHNKRRSHPVHNLKKKGTQ